MKKEKTVAQRMIQSLENFADKLERENSMTNDTRFPESWGMSLFPKPKDTVIKKGDCTGTAILKSQRRNRKDHVMVDCDCEYDCLAEVVEEFDGRYSVYGVNLPGCLSYGDTRQEALENVREAFELLVSSYEDDNEEIPWDKGSTDLLVGNFEHLEMGRYYA